MGKGKRSFGATYPLELIDGSTVPLFLSHRRLLELRGADRKAYDAFNRAQVAMAKGKESMDLEGVTLDILTAAYLCGQLEVEGGLEGSLTADEFIDLMPFDAETNNEALAAVWSPKAAAASARRSGETPAAPAV